MSQSCLLPSSSTIVCSRNGLTRNWKIYFCPVSISTEREKNKTKNIFPLNRQKNKSWPTTTILRCSTALLLNFADCNKLDCKDDFSFQEDQYTSRTVRNDNRNVKIIKEKKTARVLTTNEWFPVGIRHDGYTKKKKKFNPKTQSLILMF